MTRAICIAASLFFVACGPADQDSATPVGTASPREALEALAAGAGWTVQAGGFSTATMAHCCEPLVHCLGADPAAPYSTLSVPPAPDQAAPDPDLYWMWGDVPAGTGRDFRMRPDEALVWIGTTPPEVDYFGFRTLLSTRPDETGSRQRVLGAMGPPLNQVGLAAERGVALSELWNQPLVVITAADQATEDQVRSWLITAGYPESAIALDRIAATSAQMGFELAADSFVSLVQALDPADPVALDRWREDADTAVLRLTPGGEALSTAPFGAPKLPDRGSGVYEDYAVELDALREALREQWAARPAFPGVVTWDWHQTFACLIDLDCQADSHDRLRAESIAFPLDGQTFAVAYGVNHVATGKSTATTLAVHRSLTGTGVAWIDDEALMGTARPFLGDNYPRVDELYAIVISRDCSFFSVPCVEVPSTCPGPLPGEDLYISWGLYLEPTTGAAPLQAELNLDRVLKFFPEQG